jgi:hypothetical protein
MPAPSYKEPFTQDVLNEIFPPDRADRFFDALFGDAAEGAYDIILAFGGETQDRIEFEFQLKQRPGRCLACNLTYGLPDVFMRHPVIDVAGLIRQIESRMPNGKRCGDWKIGRTREVSRGLHVMPLIVNLVAAEADEAR